MGAGPKWRRFEQLVAAIHFAESKGAQVAWNDEINGRQFDVTVRFKHGVYEYLTVIECKDKDSKVPVGDVDAFVTKSRDVNANKAVMVSSRGYQSGCMPVAARHGVKLLILSETAAPQVDQLIKQVVPMLAIDSVRFERGSAAKDYELDDVGGRLTWLMLHARIKHDGREFSPDQAVSEWLSCLDTPPAQTQEVRVPFEGGAFVDIPLEDAFEAQAFKFQARIVNGWVAEGPAVDAHIFASMYTDVELRGVDGKLEHRTRLRDVPFGFATQMEAGKYYTDPNTYMHYYCRKIDGEVMHLTLVESYQHGIRVGADFTAKKQFATNYVEITDKKTLQRLQRIREAMLESAAKSETGS
jgi:hypothetical protein